MRLGRKCWYYLGIIVIMFGCLNNAGDTGTEPTIAIANRFKVALLLEGSVDDHGWNQAAYEGLRLVEKELEAQIAYTANVANEDMAFLFRQYAEDDFDFIIGHGGEFISSAEVVAKEFSAIAFAVTAGYAGNNVNLGALSFRDGEMGYLTGVVAGLKTVTNKVAYIGGVAYDHTREQAILFERGVQAINPEAEVTIAWLGSWSDKEKARITTQVLAETGIDVVVVVANEAGVAAFEVVEQHGIYAIGWSLDQHELAPKSILTSAIQRVPHLFLAGAKLVQRDRWEGKQYKFGIQDGAQDLASFYGLLSPDEEALVQSIRQDIITGKIDVTP